MGKIFKNYTGRSSSLKTNWKIRSFTETYSEPCKTSKKEFLTKIVISFSFFYCKKLYLKMFERILNHVPQTACVIKMIMVESGGTSLSKISVNERQPLAAWTIFSFFLLNVYLFLAFWKCGRITGTENKLNSCLYENYMRKSSHPGETPLGRMVYFTL